MKKIMMVTVISVLLASMITGCSGGVKLEVNQVEYSYGDDGDLTLNMLMEDKELEDEFDVDFDDKEKEIEEDLLDYIEDEIGDDVELKKFKKNKEDATIEMYFEDAEDMYGEIDQSFEDYAEDLYGLDLDELEEEEEFVIYKSEKDLDEDDYEDYEDGIVIRVYGGEEGSYYTFPGKVLLVGDKVDYEKESNQTIFIDEDEYGIIVVEEF